MEIKHITTPLTQEKLKSLKSGDSVLISGTMYTGRDAAHQRLVDAINNGEKLPFDPKDAIIYYVGPAPTKPGNVIGSAGPTTSYRMDDLTVPLLELGLTGMIGKGLRSKTVVDSMKKNGAIYFAAIGGAGALISKSIKECEIIAFEDLGPEAVRKLTVVDFPAVVVIDSEGNNLYETERKKYQK
ncbi:Fe-S-containing hydro-lyase [Clostridium estertheticum]|uniref:Fe-S-containing hydro-lyase n=1 Tax=Clostridium estertheticum TaxID=238834 RepID=A0AA47I872_9CLOT|nr:Fe-S-containing hydro-lyase [Clostridium estertheticum]MBU3153622.1 Fe-S-containing hydro-lyase [Clostridium estertheticum]MBU3198975.1 Fe-S-containing hydro-lyase [Clostridium estertheticum]MCB2353979.1 Fe-S-containing hydro-lyase [Clostridium estertheticum]WAG43117.1 Fe-S-containing hydro-lyase [Clostridium estertheticum]WAG61585.1 Fe-S-containing hydro-lyase [Clostridium estertheticum]